MISLLSSGGLDGDACFDGDAKSKGEYGDRSTRQSQYLRARSRLSVLTSLRNPQWPETHWSPSLLTGPSFTRPKLILGFLGFGRISHSVLSRFLSFTLPVTGPDAPRVIYTSSRKRDNQEDIDEGYSRRFGVKVQWVDKDELASKSDVLVVLCNLNDSTKGIVGTEFLSKMKKTSVLVNTARASHVEILLRRQLCTYTYTPSAGRSGGFLGFV